MENTSNYKNGTDKQKSFADKLKSDAIATINADADKVLKLNPTDASRAQIETLRNNLMNTVIADDDVNSVINKLNMNTWKTGLIAKAYGYTGN